MSGLVGIWNLDGEPVARETLAAMSARLAHRGPDGEKLLLLGPAGFAYQKLCVTPESLQEVQPFQDPSGAVVLWDGRLDNRDELLEALSEERLAHDVPDAALVAAAYRAFGEDFLLRLNGDFALTVYDPQRKKLFLARDIMGTRMLHYCRFGNHFLFASEAKALLAHPAVKTAPDEQALAEWFYQIPDYSDATRCFFRGISIVPHGHVVTISPEKTESRLFWDFDVHHQLRLRNHSEYVEAYRMVFEKAVRNRMRSAFPLTASVSGGLDSSSVFCQMLRLAGEDQALPQKITGIAFASEDPRIDESHYRSHIEQEYGVTISKIPLRAITTMSEGAAKSDAWYSEGPYLKWEVWRKFFEASVGRGARVAFSGYFGDNVLTNPQYLLDLLSRGRLIAAATHLRKMYDWWEGEKFRDNTWMLYMMMKGYLVPERLRPLYQALRRREREPKQLPWLSERLTSKAQRQRNLLETPSGPAHSKALYQSVHSRRLSVRHDLDARADAKYPCEPVYPYRDRDLIALLMSIPGEIVYRSGCRGIQRDAAVGLLPEKIRIRRTKAVFTSAGSLGAILDLERVRPRLETGIARSMGYLAPDGVLAAGLDQLRSNLRTDTTAAAGWWAGDLVALEEWLSTFFA